MDGLFTGSPGDRRRFLDRLVLAIDSSTAPRQRAGASLAQSKSPAREWFARPALLDAAEREVAELGIAVAAARQETIARLAALIASGADESSPFPGDMRAGRGNRRANRAAFRSGCGRHISPYPAGNSAAVMLRRDEPSWVHKRATLPSAWSEGAGGVAMLHRRAKGAARRPRSLAMLGWSLL